VQYCRGSRERRRDRFDVAHIGLDELVDHIIGRCLDVEPAQPELRTKVRRDHRRDPPRAAGDHEVSDSRGARHR